jgi:hypothetical protein
MHKLLQELFPKGFTSETPDPDWNNGDCNFQTYYYDRFSKGKALVVCVTEEFGVYQVSVDNLDVYNKSSQCPIHFILTEEQTVLKNAIRKVLPKAIKYLGTKEGARHSNTDWYNANYFDEVLSSDYMHHQRNKLFK